MTAKEVFAYWEKVSRPKAIREYCIDCSGGSTGEATLCTVLSCPLWGWRFGSKPGSKAFLARMEKARENKPKEFDEAYSFLAEGGK